MRFWKNCKSSFFASWSASSMTFVVRVICRKESCRVVRLQQDDHFRRDTLAAACPFRQVPVYINLKGISFLSCWCLHKRLPAIASAVSDGKLPSSEDMKRTRSDSCGPLRHPSQVSLARRLSLHQVPCRSSRPLPERIEDGQLRASVFSHLLRLLLPARLPRGAVLLESSRTAH